MHLGRRNETTEQLTILFASVQMMAMVCAGQRASGTVKTTALLTGWTETGRQREDGRISLVIL